MDRRRNQRQREAFEELQKRKKRKLQSSEERQKNMNNPAKSSPKGRRKKRMNDPEKGSTESRRNLRARKKRERPHRVGLALAILQALVSVAFMLMLNLVGIVPLKYMAVAAGILIVLFLAILFSQLRKKGKAIVGKLVSILLIVTLSFGTYYIGKANGALDQITGGSYKVDNMVVAVLKDDPAESIEDAKSYTFGVQYKMGKADMEAAVSYIQEELGTDIELKEYEDIQKQAEALHDGEVNAIVYNEGYTENMSEAFTGFKKNVRVIYEHKIKKELASNSVDADIQEPFSVYISGIDVYGDIEQTSRSDVNIIATVNPKTHQVLLVTTPRDYYVPIPGVSHGEPDKLTHAGNHGVDVSMKTLEELYQVEIPFFVRINFTSLIEIVDQLGGVDVNSEYAFTTSRNSEHVMDVSEGINHFNGEEALAFSRERENVPGGDNQRGKNQQAVITAMIKKMISPQMLLKANGIIDSVSGNVETNMSEKQIQSLIKMQLNKGGSWNIYSVAAEGSGGGKDYCYSIPGQLVYVTYPDEDSVAHIQDLINRVEQGEVLEGSDVAE